MSIPVFVSATSSTSSTSSKSGISGISGKFGTGGTSSGRQRHGHRRAAVGAVGLARHRPLISRSEREHRPSWPVDEAGAA